MFPLSTGRTLADGCCPRVQLLATHPLEATLAGAPLLLHAVAAGAVTGVCAVTPGAERPVAASSPVPPTGVGDLRTDELRRAGRRLWVSGVEVLDRPDDEALRGSIRSFAPDVVVVVAGPTPLHDQLLRAATGLGVRVYALTTDGSAGGAVGPSAGLRVPLSMSDHVWTWRRALAEHGSETAVPLPDEAAPPHVVLERVDGPGILVHTRHGSRGRLRLVHSTEARSA